MNRNIKTGKLVVPVRSHGDSKMETRTTLHTVIQVFVYVCHADLRTPPPKNGVIDSRFFGQLIEAE